MPLLSGYGLRSSGFDSAFVFTRESEVLDVKEEEVGGTEEARDMPSVSESSILFRRMAEAKGCRLHKP